MWIVKQKIENKKNHFKKIICVVAPSILDLMGEVVIITYS